LDDLIDDMIDDVSYIKLNTYLNLDKDNGNWFIIIFIL
jgi:hypothetical protein